MYLLRPNRPLIKPAQWGPVSSVRDAVRDWFENTLGCKAPFFLMPFWERAGIPRNIMEDCELVHAAGYDKWTPETILGVATDFTTVYEIKERILVPPFSGFDIIKYNANGTNGTATNLTNHINYGTRFSHVLDNSQPLKWFVESDNGSDDGTLQWVSTANMTAKPGFSCGTVDKNLTELTTFYKQVGGSFSTNASIALVGYDTFTFLRAGVGMYGTYSYSDMDKLDVEIALSGFVNDALRQDQAALLAERPYEMLQPRSVPFYSFASAGAGATLAAAINLQTQTPDAAIVVSRALSAAPWMVSNTPNVVMSVPRQLACTAAMQSIVTDVDITVARDLATAINLVTNIPDAELLVPLLTSLSATVDVKTNTPDAVLSVPRSLSGSAAIASQVPDASIIVSRSLASNTVLQSQTPDAALTIARELAAIVGVQTTTADSLLILIRELAGLIAISSLTPDADLVVPGDGMLAATIAMQTMTPDAALKVERKLSADVSIQAITLDSQMIVARLMAAQIVGDSITPDAVITVARSISATIGLITQTPDVDLILSALGTILNPALESKTPLRTLVSMTPQRVLISKTPVRTIARL